MKNRISILASAASAVLILFTSCNKEVDYVQPADEPVEETGVIFHEVQLIAGNEMSKSYLASDGDGGYISKWDSDDQVALFQKNSIDGYRTKISSSKTTLSDSDRTAAFTLSLAEVTGASNYKYWAAYPTSAVTRSNDDLQFVLPNAQTISAGKFDKAADMMISSPVERAEYSSDALETAFARIGSIVKLTLSGLTAGETVKSVVFSTEETGKYLAGTIKYDLTKDALKTGVTSGSQSITLTPSATLTVPNDANNKGSVEVWMRTAEVTLTEDFTVVVNTKDATTNYAYTKAIDLSTAGKTVAFKSGKLGALSVGSKGWDSKATVSYNPLLPVGYYVIHYSDGSSTDKALSNTCASDKGGFLDALDNPFSDDGNGKYNVAASNLKFLWELRFDDEDNKYAFYSIDSDKYMSGDLNNSSTSAVYFYMGANSGDYSGTYSIYDGSTFASAKHVGYNYNSGTNPRFKFYAAPVSNYPGYLTFTPAYASPVVTYSNVSLASSDEMEDVASKTPTKYLFVKSLELVGVYSDEDCTVEADWIDVEVSDETTGELSYWAAENTDDESRTAYVKLTAGGDGSTSADVVFTVTQPEAGGSGTVYWTMITKTSDLEADDQFIIVNEANNVAMAAQNGNYRDTTKINKILDATNHRIDNADVEKNSKIQILTLGGSSGAWTFYTGSGYLQQPSNNNYLTTNKDVTADNQKWDLYSVDSSTGAAVIKSKRSSSYTIQYNSSTPRFSTYTSAQSAVQIYRKDGPHSAGLAYANTAVAKSITDGKFTNKLTNPHELPVTYLSTVTSVATVDKDGEVTIVGAGSTTITASSDATSSYKAGSASYTLTVSKLDGGLYFTNTAVEKKVGDSSFTQTVNNPNSLTGITYESTNTSVATVNSSTGAVTILAKGETTISASGTGNATYADDSASYTLTVSAWHAVTISTPSNGEITVTKGSDELSSGDEVPEGATITLVAEPATDYVFAGWDVYKTGDSSTKVTVTSNSFTMPEYAVTITASFEEGGNPTISMNTTSITGVVAAGVTTTTASAAYNLLYDADNDDVTITCDGTVVVSASKNTTTAGKINYTVSANTGAARNGWIKVKYGTEDPHTITVSQVAGVTSTDTYTFTSKAWADSGSAWTSGKDGTAFFSGTGVQVSTSTSGANATTKSSYSNVTQVVVTYSTNASKGAGTIGIKVGSNTERTQDVTKTGGTTDRTLTYNISPAETGNVKITVSCTTNSIYVKSVSITRLTD